MCTPYVHGTPTSLNQTSPALNTFHPAMPSVSFPPKTLNYSPLLPYPPELLLMSTFCSAAPDAAPTPRRYRGPRPGSTAARVRRGSRLAKATNLQPNATSYQRKKQR